MTNPDEMTEAELAEYYYQNRHDLAGEVAPSRKPDKITSSRLDNPIEAATEAAEENVAETLGLDGPGALSRRQCNLIDYAIHAAAPILIQHGRELAARAILAELSEHGSSRPWVVEYAARLAQGEEE